MYSISLIKILPLLHFSRRPTSVAKIISAVHFLWHTQLPVSTQPWHAFSAISPSRALASATFGRRTLDSHWTNPYESVRVWEKRVFGLLWLWCIEIEQGLLHKPIVDVFRTVKNHILEGQIEKCNEVCVQTYLL